MARSLTVSVTGHRLNQLPEAQRPRIAQEISRVLGAIEDAGRSSHGLDVRLTLCSAIAEGADRYAADAALDRGWRLITPLPFAIDRYEKDFGDTASVDAFQRYLKLSDKVWSMGDVDVAAAGSGGAAPYAAVGIALVEQADVLIAVWNGQAPAGPGGTAEVGARMIEGGGPVIWIHTLEPLAGRLILPRPLPRGSSLARKLINALGERFDQVERPGELRMAHAGA
ncbi:MAG: hypothetical protein ACOYKM_07870 [Caulobacterales bacterium]|jgi:hypothetical protein